TRVISAFLPPSLTSNSDAVMSVTGLPSFVTEAYTIRVRVCDPTLLTSGDAGPAPNVITSAKPSAIVRTDGIRDLCVTVYAATRDIDRGRRPTRLSTREHHMIGNAIRPWGWLVFVFVAGIVLAAQSSVPSQTPADARQPGDYKLGPDSLPQPGVPKGKLEGP